MRKLPIAILGVLAAVASAAPAAAASCDRACLITLTDHYVAALAAHDPRGLPMAAKVAFVENVTRMKVGEGLWQSASGGATAFSVHVPDAQNQTAGWIGMMARGGEPVMVAIRLKLIDGRIVEAEHLVTPVRKDNIAELQTPRAGLLADVPGDKRLPHDALIRIGARYYDALDDNDGTKMPFAADCERHENGMITAGPRAGAGPNNAGTAPIAHDCAGQLSSKVMTYIDRIENRRVFAADPETGLVMGLSHFRHPMTNFPYTVTALDGSKIVYDKTRMNFAPFDLPAAHVFKIGADHQVHEIEAMGFMAKYNSPTGWE